jgi:hypothetical protein
MYGLVMLLTQIIMGPIESASTRLTHQVLWRIPIYLIICGSAAWVAVASACLWTSAAYPGVIGLVAFVRHGGPAWLLSIPLVALMVVLTGSIPVAGRYGLVFLFQTATFWLTLIGMATFQANGHAALNVEAVSSFLVTLPATLLSVVTALADTPPLDSPLAVFTFSYFGRLGHLRALNATAHRLAWKVELSGRPVPTLAASGYYGSGRSVHVASGATFTNYGPNGRGGYWYHVTVTSQRLLPGFAVSRDKIPAEFVAYARTGTVAGSLNFYVIPPSGRHIAGSWMQRFAEQVASGKRYMRTRHNRVEPIPGGLLYTAFNPFHLTPECGRIEPLVDWLMGIATMLEEIAPEVEQAGAPSIEAFAPRLPYGQSREGGSASHA